MKKLIQQAFYVPETDVYYNNTHDFTGHVFSDGMEYHIDEGCSYSRVIGNIDEVKNRIVNFNLYTSDEGEFVLTEDVAEKLLWSIETGSEKIRYRPMSELNESQLEKIVFNNRISLIHRTAALYWVNSKTMNKMTIPEIIESSVEKTCFV